MNESKDKTPTFLKAELNVRPWFRQEIENAVKRLELSGADEIEISNASGFKLIKVKTPSTQVPSNVTVLMVHSSGGREYVITPA